MQRLLLLFGESLYQRSDVKKFVYPIPLPKKNSKRYFGIVFLT